MSCGSPIGWETLVDWWAGDLGEDEAEAIEEHLLGCESCSREASQVAETAEAVRTMVPPVVGPEKLRRLAGSGMRILENPVLPGQTCTFHYPGAADLVVHVLGGLTLSSDARVEVTIRAEVSGDVLGRHEDAPFDAERGAVLLACQRDYAELDHDIVAEVRLRDAPTETSVARYTIHHHF